jgi:hypothetical protein
MTTLLARGNSVCTPQNLMSACVHLSSFTLYMRRVTYTDNAAKALRSSLANDGAASVCALAQQYTHYCSATVCISSNNLVRNASPFQ